MRHVLNGMDFPDEWRETRRERSLLEGEWFQRVQHS